MVGGDGHWQKEVNYWIVVCVVPTAFSASMFCINRTHIQEVIVENHFLCCALLHYLE